jgi:hypothetical protein
MCTWKASDNIIFPWQILKIRDSIANILSTILYFYFILRGELCSFWSVQWLNFS